MCGIVGLINIDSSSVQADKVKRMMFAIKHRGPDDDGVFIDNNVGFGFVRLSIIDLTQSGHQPMESNDKRYIIIFNGEIYNYLELKEQLKGKYNFKTATDTEVILASFIEWGEDCLNKFNGMFALAIYDKKEKTVFGARDRFGVKPFYFYRDFESIIFASEIPAILSVLNSKPKANHQTIYDYLAFNRTDQTNQTFFEDIYKLQHGQKFIIKENILKITNWYDLRTVKALPFETSEEFKNLFFDSIKLRLRSDVPIGVCLSGGLDSSSIMSTILNSFNQDMNSFSAIYGSGLTGDESKFINIYEKQVKNMFFVTPTGASLMKDKEIFIRAHAEPTPSTSPYAQFKVMELAAKQVVVTLDGQGADEHLAGYPYFFGFYFKELLGSFKLLTLISEISSYLRIHRSIYGLKTFVYFILPDFLKSGLRNSERGYLNKNFEKEYSSSNAIVSNLYSSKGLKESLYRHFEYKLEHLLKWSDRNSMAFSLESRAPFLDYRLVERSLATPSSMKIFKGNTKFILRNAMIGILPEAIRLRQDKVGFETPDNAWFREEPFKAYILEMINSETFKNRPYFDAAKIAMLYQNHLSGHSKISKEIWKWINLEIWHREFID